MMQNLRNSPVAGGDLPVNGAAVFRWRLPQSGHDRHHVPITSV